MKPILLIAFNKRLLRLIVELTTLILTFYLPTAMEQHRSLVEAFFTRVLQLVDERGIAFTVKYVKSSRLAVTRFITGHPLTELDGVGLKDGWPIWLSDLKALTSSGSGIKLLLTLLISLRGIHLKPILDVTPIISPWGGSDPITGKEFATAVRSLGIRPLKIEWSRFHMSTKSGPCGQAILTSLTELTLLPQSLVDNIRLLGGEGLGKVIDLLLTGVFGDLSLASIWATLFPPKTSSFRKLSYFSDKEGKTRVIAILDYWSQTVLRPYHQALNGLLRRIPTDCTFDQGSFKSRMTSLSSFHSLDLSNATDRMPLQLQKRLFGYIFGEAQANAWADILVGYEYNSKGNPSVIYNTGQPMGAYSSWCAMALTHHLIVQVAAQRAGFLRFKGYCLLGDDIVIANAAVAQQYRDLLQVLDMPISEQKTHVSEDTFEFAKRWIHKGEEVTGFSIAGINSVWKRYSLLHNYLLTQLHHGWELEISRHPELISAIYKLFGKPQQSERVIKLYMVFDSLAQAKNTGDHSILLERVEEFFGIPVSQQLLRLSVEHSTLDSLGKLIRIEAAKRIVERDFGRFQRDAYAISAKLNAMFRSKFPGLDVQSYRKALGKSSPLILVLNGMILESAQILNKEFGRALGITRHSTREFQAIAGWEPGQRVADDSYLNVGLAKYFVSKGVFSMRASHSLTMADSMLVKLILDICRELVDEKWTPEIIVVDPTVEDPPTYVRKELRPVHYQSGPVIRIPPRW
jgi:hypothetical protein